MKVNYLAKAEGGTLSPIAPAVVAGKLAKFAQGTVVKVTVDDEKQRTPQQNARYWTLIVPAFAEYAGNDLFSQYAELRGITPKDSAHNVLKAHILGTFDITLPDGSVVTVERSTASLSVAEFADYQDRAERFLNSLGIYLPAQEAA